MISRYNSKFYIKFLILYLFRFLAHFQPNSIIHKEMLAVLAAVTEVIKQNGGTESSTEYYAALVRKTFQMN